ncbi:bola protein [Peziza echinospora]|nr:bola protein [Peziza echinospora]
MQSQRGYSTSAGTPSAEQSAEVQSKKTRLQSPDNLDEKERHIFDKLASSLEPSRLEVRDVSGGCGSMYAIEIASSKFRGLPMIRQHRLVQGVLEDEIKGWHGIQLKTKLE